MPNQNTCVDCEAGLGELHEFFCPKERCPFCAGQLASCECISTVLKLTDQEQEVYDEYIDDFEEPLRGIVARWQDALTRKGRIPFGSKN